MMNEQKSQLEQANDLLISLSPSVTTEDRKKAKVELDLSDFTISQYLNGNGRNLDTAMKFIGFFRKRIEDRQVALA